MAVTFGFYNSMNGDRRYDAIQMSSIFDGIIQDGVYQSIGEAFSVKVGEDGRSVTVGSGRAWFNHTWTLNTTRFELQINDASPILDRIDAVVLEVDARTSVRANSIKVISGTPSSNAQRPTLTRSTELNQYPLAYVTRKKNTDALTQADIQSMIGTSACPFVIGVLTVLKIDDFIANWQSQWNNWFTENTGALDNAFDEWMSEQQTDFYSWFNNLQLILDGTVASNLANEILKLQQFRKDLLIDHRIYDPLQTQDGEDILTSYGPVLEGTIKFCIEPYAGAAEECREGPQIDVGYLKALIQAEINKHEYEVVDSYSQLSDKPKIEGVQLVGDKLLSDFGLRSITDEEIDSIFEE